jgi:hypothetical protein
LELLDLGLLCFGAWGTRREGALVAVIFAFLVGIGVFPFLALAIASFVLVLCLLLFRLSLLL